MRRCFSLENCSLIRCTHMNLRYSNLFVRQSLNLKVVNLKLAKVDSVDFIKMMNNYFGVIDHVRIEIF